MKIRLVYQNKKTGEIQFNHTSIVSYSLKPMKNFELIAINKSTGLLDKNKQEIYEGDIFMPYKGEYSEYSHYRPSFIYFDDHYSAFRLKADEDESGLELNKFVYGKFFEVAGNVYENESLLILKEDDLGHDFVDEAKEMSQESLKE